MRIILFKSTVEKVNAFNTLQVDFIEPSFLAYFQSNCKLYINLNTSKEKGIGVIIYYVKGDFMASNNIKWGKIKSILFLNYILLAAKLKYQPIKLKVTGLIQIIKKVHYIIASTT